MAAIEHRESLLLRGTLDMCVLALLVREPRHAYGVVRQLQEHGFETASYGSVYPLVGRLRRQGLLEQVAAEGERGPGRQVLHATDAGRHALAAWVRQWHATNDRIESVLEGSRDG